MSKAKPTRKTAKPSSQTTLALSSLHLNLETLEKEHQWLIKQIKRKRTELDNFVEQLRSLATQVVHRTNSVMQQMITIDQEIHRLFDEILDNPKLGKKTRYKVEDIYQNLQIMGVISPQGSQDEDEDEDEDEELNELFEEQEPNLQEQKSSDPKHIRKAFLKLAEIFHPDKVSDEETHKRHTEIMKEINRAYQENDLARLLEIEKQHLSGENIATDNQDDLTRRCYLLEQQNQILRTQYEDLKRELNMIKRTPEGSMVSDYRKAIKEDIDPIEMMVKQAEQEVKYVADIRDFVKDFRDKKITVQQFMKGPPSLREIKQEMLEELFEEMFGVSVEVTRF